jgi:uncharacterized protein
MARVDCSKPETRVEYLVFSDAEVAAFDVQLAELYKPATGTTNDVGQLREQPRNWPANGRDRSAHALCLGRNYTERIAELSGRTVTLR